jgi:uncharacterized cupin superfamily protein
MPSAILVTAAETVRLAAAPISPAQILGGIPREYSKILAMSQDRTARIMVWECSAGEFAIHYPVDETAVVIAGEAFVTNDAGEECRLAEGHVAFFPAGSSSRWRITRPIKKVAVLRQDLPWPTGFAVRAWHRLLRIAGVRPGWSLSPAAAGSATSAAAGEAHGSNGAQRRTTAAEI